jgi:hypothetical protein
VQFVGSQGLLLNKAAPERVGFLFYIALSSLHPEIEDFRMGHSVFSAQQSASLLVIMDFLLKAET